MRRTLRRLAVAGLFAVFVLSGCQDGRPNKGKVKGTVTLDGRPLEKGSVLFISTDNTTPSSSAEIRNGTFAGEVYVGQMNVQVLSPQVVGKRKVYDTPDSPEADVLEERIPAKYNTETVLTADVKPGEQELNFPLKNK